MGLTKESSGEFKVDPLINLLAGKLPVVGPYVSIAKTILEMVVNKLRKISTSGRVSIASFFYDFQADLEKGSDREHMEGAWSLFRASQEMSISSTGQGKKIIAEIFDMLPKWQDMQKSFIKSWIGSGSDSDWWGFNYDINEGKQFGYIKLKISKLRSVTL